MKLFSSSMQISEFPGLSGQITFLSSTHCSASLTNHMITHFCIIIMQNIEKTSSESIFVAVSFYVLLSTLLPLFCFVLKESEYLNAFCLWVCFSWNSLSSQYFQGRSLVGMESNRFFVSDSRRCCPTLVFVVCYGPSCFFLNVFLTEPDTVLGACFSFGLLCFVYRSFQRIRLVGWPPDMIGLDLSSEVNIFINMGGLLHTKEQRCVWTAVGLWIQRWGDFLKGL